MKVSNEIMTKKVVGITLDDSLLLAYRLMQEYEIRHLPVYDSGKNLVGVLSDRDIQRALLRSEGKEEISLSDQKKVREYMSMPAITVSHDAPVIEVSALLRLRKISAVMVLDEKAVPCGIITTDDLLSCLERILSRDGDLESKPLSFFFPSTLF